MKNNASVKPVRKGRRLFMRGREKSAGIALIIFQLFRWKRIAVSFVRRYLDENSISVV